MSDSLEIEEMKNIIREFFRKLGFETTIQFPPPQDSTFFVRITTKEPRSLIGEKGQNLLSIERLLRLMLLRKVKGEFRLDLDINGYKGKKKEYLRELARSLADDVSLEKKERVLPPMPAYERRIIHMELAARDDVSTESIGQGLERRVVIKPYP